MESLRAINIPLKFLENSKLNAKIIYFLGQIAYLKSVFGQIAYSNQYIFLRQNVY